MYIINPRCVHICTYDLFTRGYFIYDLFPECYFRMSTGWQFININIVQLLRIILFIEQRKKIILINSKETNKMTIAVLNENLQNVLWELFCTEKKTQILLFHDKQQPCHLL